jgi:hypothetical protein
MAFAGTCSSHAAVAPVAPQPGGDPPANPATNPPAADPAVKPPASPAPQGDGPQSPRGRTGIRMHKL